MPIDANTSWRDAARTPRFYIVDAYAIFPLALFLLHITWWTFFTAIAFVVFFAALERFKFTLPVFFRWSRATLAGPLRVSRPWWRS